MANVTIPSLPSVTAATDLDILVITNSVGTTTSKITRADLLNGTTTPPVFEVGTGTDSIRASYLPAAEASNTKTFSVGEDNTASGVNASVVGGLSNTASGLRSSVFGGHNNTASNNTATAVGGFQNTSNAQFSITLGGRVSSITGEGGGLVAMDSSSWTLAPYSIGAGLNDVDYTGGNKRGNAAIGASQCVLSYMEQSGIYSTYESDIVGTSGNDVKRSFIMGGTGNTLNANVNKSGILGGNDNTISASAENVIIAASSGRTSLYNYTLHTDNIHTFKTETFNVISGGNVGGNVDVDCSLGTLFTFTMTANTTPNFINLKTGQRFMFIINNTTFNVPAATINGVSGNVYAKNGTISPSSNSITKYTATYDGTRLFLDEEGAFSAV